MISVAEALNRSVDWKMARRKKRERMTIPALLRAYASEFGFPVYDPENRRFVDPAGRRFLRLVSVVSRQPAVILVSDSSRGIVRYGQDRPGGRPHLNPSRPSA
jgi:hypothetical protein